MKVASQCPLSFPNPTLGLVRSGLESRLVVESRSVLGPLEGLGLSNPMMESTFDLSAGNSYEHLKLLQYFTTMTSHLNAMRSCTATGTFD
jgi:hypothetical protein